MGKFKVKLARILDRMRPHLKQVKNEEKNIKNVKSKEPKEQNKEYHL